VDKIKDLQTKLHRSYHKPLPTVPTIHSDEMPEKRMEYTREILIKFKEEEKTRAEAEKKAAAGMGDGGFFGGFGGGDEGGEKKDKDDKEDKDGEEDDVEEPDMYDVPTVPGASQGDGVTVSAVKLSSIP